MLLRVILDLTIEVVGDRYSYVSCLCELACVSAATAMKDRALQGFKAATRIATQSTVGQALAAGADRSRFYLTLLNGLTSYRAVFLTVTKVARSITYRKFERLITIADNFPLSDDTALKPSLNLKHRLIPGDLCAPLRSAISKGGFARVGCLR